MFLAAKAAEGAAAKTLDWYGMILRRAVRGLGDDRPIEQLAGPELRAWILELRSTLSLIPVTNVPSYIHQAPDVGEVVRRGVA